MPRVLIWDLPTRIFHWLLAAGFLTAFAIAQFLGDDHPLFAWHGMLGLILGGAVAFRLIWGLIGTRYARFGSFAYGPAAVADYFKGVFTGRGKRYIGHNPASGYAILVMLALVIAIVATGLLMPVAGHTVKELHEITVYALLLVAVVHVAGVVIHTIRSHENLTVSMISGAKQADESDGIRGPAPVAASVFLLALALLTGGLIRNFDSAAASTRLPLIGVTIQLGESEGDGHDENERPWPSHREHEND
ncbi:cytochrome b [Planctomycetales bacterium ZRK34]|nr:cytochrome b [Planctomycetales bacterium ZRK34]